MIPEYCTVKLLRGAAVFNLSDGALCKVSSMQGIGPMPTVRLSEQGPLQHGVTDRGFRAQQRLIRLLLYFQVGNTSDYWDRREDLNAALEPTTGLAQLQFDLGNGDRRQIACSIRFIG